LHPRQIKEQVAKLLLSFSHHAVCDDHAVAVLWVALET